MASRKRNRQPRKNRKAQAGSDRKGLEAPAQQVPFWKTSWFPWVTLAVLAGLAYFNAWPDVFVFDDREFLADGRFAGLTAKEYAGLFSQPLWEASGSTTQLYRPMFVLTLGLEYLVFGDWAAGFHLFNILMHIVAVWMVFGFTRLAMKRLFPENTESALVALLASALFAVHPAFSEVVNSVFNGSEIYVVIGIAGSLWYLLLNAGRYPVRAWSVVGVVYFVILLYRESAVSLPALAVATICLASEEGWKARVRKCLPVLILVIPLAGYMAMRSHAMELLVQPVVQQQVDTADRVPATPGGSQAKSPVTGLSLNSDRISSAVIVWFDGLKKLVWPHPLVTLHGASRTSLPLAVLVQLSLLALAVVAALRKKPAFLLGLAIYYLAILPSSRIVAEGTLVPVLMERMLYLPSVGIVIFAAAGLHWLTRRTASRIPVVSTIAVVLVLLPVTWARNSDWSSDLALMEHDFYVTEKNGQLFYSLVAANRRSGALAEAMTLCETYAGNYTGKEHIQRECGLSFATAGRLDGAEAYYHAALKAAPRGAWSHFELARLYAGTERRDLAKTHFDQAISYEKLPFLRELMSAFKLMDLYPHDRQKLQEASAHVDNALQLQPRSREAKQLRQQLDQRL